MTTNVGGIVYDVSMDTAGLLQARREIEQALSGLNGTVGRIDTNVTRTERSISSMSTAMSRLSGVASALMAALSVRQIAEYADAWVTLNNKLANAIRPNEQLAEVTQRVFDISQRTMSSLDATATLYARLERATRSAGTGTAYLIKLTETINKGLVVSGATTQEASSTMIQLSQALASGVLRGEEFNSISENGSRLAVALAQSLGVTMGQLRAMAAQGKLTTDVVVKGLLSQGDQIAKEFANTAMTLGQAFSVATNNVTKFVGESSTIKSIYAVSSKSIVSLSENLDALAGVVTVLAGVMGSRFVAALTMAAAAQLKSSIASMAAAKTAAESAAAAELEAAAKLRSAEADKGAAISALNLAQARMNVIKATNGSSVAEVQLAEAQAAQIRTQIAQIESEKALEVQRLKSQISEQGRIATATRMAQLQQAQASLSTRLASAEAATQQARAAAIQGAEAQVSAARLATADATGVATAANARYTASQEAATAAARAASTSMGLLRTGLGLLGGPVGAAMLAGVAVYYFWQKAQQAREEAIRFADSLDKVNSSMKAMNNNQLRGTIADANDSIKAQKESIDDLKSTISQLEYEYNKYTSLARQYGVSEDENNGFVIKAKEAADNLAKAKRDLSNAEDKLSRTQDTASEATRTLTNNMLTAMGVHDGLIEKGWSLERVQGAVAKAFGLTADEINRANQAGKNFNPKALQVSPPTKEADKLILSLDEQNKLLQIQDERQRAVTKARMEAAKVTDNPNQISRAGNLAGENYDLQEAEKKREEAQRKAEQQDKKAANQAESNAQKLAKLKSESELAADSTTEMSRAQAILTAQLSLNKGATQEDIRLAGEYAAKKWDNANAIKAEAAARKLLPETAENAAYQQDMKDLQTSLDFKKISQQQYNATAERLAQEHQSKMAKITAEQAVSPQQKAAGEVDPVQALANEQAQKLALIQQYENQRVISHATATALIQAADTTYRTNLIAAQWELWSQQNAATQTAAAAFDGFAQSASNAFTGILTGSMSAADALRSVGSTVLNDVVNTFVQMGVQWVKSSIMGAAAQQTAIAATTAASVAGTATQAAASTTAAGTTMAAWLPAALVASVGSFGAAAIIGGAALVGAFALSKTLGRKNGGVVNAGQMYEVGENGLPEIFQASNGSQYMIPGNNGRVISNNDLTGGSSSSGGVVVYNNITNNSSASVSSTSTRNNDGSVTIETLITDLEEGGPLSQAITANTTASRRATE